MKNLKKTLCLLLAVMLMFSLVTTASAATSTMVPPLPTSSATDAKTPAADTDTKTTLPPTTEGEPTVVPLPEEDTTGQAVHNVAPSMVYDPSNQWLYWARYLGTSKPEIYYDYGVKEYFLSYRLNDASKLAELFQVYYEAFALQQNLDLLTAMNDVDEAVWKKPDWREKSIGEQLSKGTTAALKAMDDLDAYTALTLIQARPEYKTDKNLQEQVDYHLAVMKSYQRDVLQGLSELDANNRPVKLSEVTAEPADTIELTKRFLRNHPELEVLVEVRDLAMSGYTSKGMTTFHTADAEEISALWQEVCEATKEYWQYTTRSLDLFRFAVPFPEGTVYQWPAEWEAPETLVEEPSPLGPPTSATGN